MSDFEEDGELQCVNSCCLFGLVAACIQFLILLVSIPFCVWSLYLSQKILSRGGDTEDYENCNLTRFSKKMRICGYIMMAVPILSLLFGTVFMCIKCCHKGGISRYIKSDQSKFLLCRYLLSHLFVTAAVTDIVAIVAQFAAIVTVTVFYFIMEFVDLSNCPNNPSKGYRKNEMDIKMYNRITPFMIGAIYISPIIVLLMFSLLLLVWCFVNLVCCKWVPKLRKREKRRLNYERVDDEQRQYFRNEMDS